MAFALRRKNPVVSRIRGIRPLPWFLVLGRDADALRALLAHAGSADPDDYPEKRAGPVWRFSAVAGWLGLPADASASGADILETIARAGCPGPRGIVAALDARDVLDWREDELRERAESIRAIARALGRANGEVPPQYVIVDRLDALYGMRNLASRLSPERTRRPLGALRSEEAPLPGQTALGAMDDALAVLAAPPSAPPPARFPYGAGDDAREADAAAALQAQDEFTRLERPLFALCAEAFAPAEDGDESNLCGVFFCSSGVRGFTVPPLPAGRPSFCPAPEPDVSGQSWFVRDLFREWLPNLPFAPRTLRRGRHRRAIAARPGFAAMLAGTLALGWGLTFSYIEGKAVLSTAPANAPAATADDVRRFGDAVARYADRNRGRLAPRLGLTEPDRLEQALRARFCREFEQAALRPAVAEMVEKSRAALAGGQAAAIGDSLWELADLRSRLDGRTPAAPGDAADPLRLYLAWSGDADLADALLRNVRELERETLARAGGGDAMRWLPEWVESRTGASGFDTPDLPVRPAWTATGYALAKALLEKTTPPAPAQAGNDRKSMLAAYRREAVAAWTDAAKNVWRGWSRAIRDDDIAAFLRDLAAGQDPASRLHAGALHNLRPMFAEADPDEAPAWLGGFAEATRPPDEQVRPHQSGRLEWLREAFAANPETPTPSAAESSPASVAAGIVGAGKWREWREELERVAVRAATGDCVELAAAHLSPGSRGRADALARLGELAAGLTADFVRADAGPLADALSPAAAYDYLRFLAARRAATQVDRQWREIFDSRDARFASAGSLDGAAENAAAAVAHFLDTAARGLWRRNGDRIDNASRDRLAFTFSREFLEYCGEILKRRDAAPAEPAALRLLVDSIGVGERARERPQTAVFELTGTGGSLIYRNFPAAGDFSLPVGAAAGLSLRLAFPSGEAVWKIAGNAELSRFAMMLNGGALALRREDFAAGKDLLERIGVREIILRGRLDGADTLRSGAPASAPTPPGTIITPGGGVSASTGDLAVL